MGLLKHLLFWPVTAPTFLTGFTARKLDEVARRELTDDSKIKEELLELQLRLELGDIDDEEYRSGEAELMSRLRDVRAWRERLGMGLAGGPVRVASPAAADPDSPGAADRGSDSLDPM